MPRSAPESKDAAHMSNESISCTLPVDQKNLQWEDFEGVVIFLIGSQIFFFGRKLFPCLIILLNELLQESMSLICG